MGSVGLGLGLAGLVSRFIRFLGGEGLVRFSVELIRGGFFCFREKGSAIRNGFVFSKSIRKRK